MLTPLTQFLVRAASRSVNGSEAEIWRHRRGAVNIFGLRIAVAGSRAARWYPDTPGISRCCVPWSHLGSGSDLLRRWSGGLIRSQPACSAGWSRSAIDRSRRCCSRVSSRCSATGLRVSNWRRSRCLVGSQTSAAASTR